MRLFIATPSYGKPCADYETSLQRTVSALESDGHHVQHKIFQGCCYVHTARNKLVRDFLMSDCERMLFVDADIGFEPDDIKRLLAHDVDIVGGAAPFRVGDLGFAASFKQDEQGFPMGDLERGLIEANVLPTAVMAIQRKPFYELARNGQSPLRIEWERSTLNERERYLSYFDFEADNRRNVEFGEDVTFCRKWQRIGGVLWIEPNMTLRHWDGDTYREGNLDHYLRTLTLPTKSAA